MKILFLGNIGSPLIETLKAYGDEVVVTSRKIDAEYLEDCKPNFIVSYGYPFIISQEVLGLFPDKAINLHISYLPWNRGSDPDLWSFLDDTPKGVTIHFLDKGIDTGDIIVQMEVPYKMDDTLSSNYKRLHEELEQLFMDNWVKIKTGISGRQKQTGKGSYHRSVDKGKYVHLLKNGYDTRVSELSGTIVR